MSETGPVNTFVAKRIRALRQERGLDIRAVARRAGIPQGSYSCLETGRYRLNLENLFRILQVLDAPVSDVWPDTAGVPRSEPVDHGYLTRAIAAAESRLPRKITLAEVVDLVCADYCLATEDLAHPSRARQHAEARTVAALLVDAEGHLKLVDLARMFERDVSSLSHCLRRLRARLKTEDALVKRVERIQRRVLRRRVSYQGHNLIDVRRPRLP